MGGHYKKVINTQPQATSCCQQLHISRLIRQVKGPTGQDYIISYNLYDIVQLICDINLNSVMYEPFKSSNSGMY